MMAKKKNPNSEIAYELKQLEKEKELYSKQIDKSKEDIINDILSIDKKDMFKKKKMTFWDKIKIVLNGRK